MTLAAFPWRMSSAQLSESAVLLHAVAQALWADSCVQSTTQQPDWSTELTDCRMSTVWKTWYIRYLLAGSSCCIFSLWLRITSFLCCACVSLSQCPLIWQNKWEGPEEPMQYLRAVVTRALAIQVTYALNFLPLFFFLYTTRILTTNRHICTCTQSKVDTHITIFSCDSTF